MPHRSAAGSGPRLLAVHAHPDDETLATGALLDTWAAAGLPTAVVTCTRGERGEVIGARLAALEGDGPALAAHREVELAGALGALGVREHCFLDRLPGGVLDRLPGGAVRPPDESGARYEDSGMAWIAGGTAGVAGDVPARAFVRVPLDDAARRLAGLLEVWAPDVVVTYDPDGGYGHPDHVRAHEVTMRALELSAAPAPVVLWRSATTAAVRAERRALTAADWIAPEATGLERPDADGALPPVADDARPVVLGVDVLAVRDQVLGAMCAHATQIQHVQAAPAGAALAGCYALSNDVLAPITAWETYAGAPSGAAASAVAWPDGIRGVA
ncbi:MAG: PIG-L family deacetylase [Cellulomonadaceae bacterium]